MKKHLIFLFVFLGTDAYAYITTDMIGGCNASNQDFAPVNNESKMYPVFTKNQYACNDNEYLPAGGIACETCPDGYACDGGTFEFNAQHSQGISPELDVLSFSSSPTCDTDLLSSVNNESKMYPVFTINTYNCSAGYYLPAGNDWVSDDDGCTICPENSYCPGGTYTFNETETQGITACPDGLFAPAGMWESGQCGRILHIDNNVVYLRSVKVTTPSLNIDMDGDGTPDFFGNMTTSDVYMHDGADKKFKVQYNGQTYSVYDDTIIP